jgi:predicted aspartyl protease
MFRNLALAIALTIAFSIAGWGADPAGTSPAASHLHVLLNQKAYVELEQSVNQQLSAEDAGLFRGIISNRKNRLTESIRLLEPLRTKLAAEAPSWREKELLKTLADDYSKAFNYAQSADTFAALLKRYGKVLSRRERRNAVERRDEMQLLRSAPPQTADSPGAFTLTSTRNTMGLIEIPVEANGQRESWVLDTGANTSVITESTARRIGLRLLEGSAQTDDLNGMPVPFRVGVLSELRIGSAVLHNVEMPVASDQALNFAGHQIQGIVGFPVQSALGRITFYADGRVGVDAQPAGEEGSELFMEGQTPIAVVKAAGAERLFSLDTGATGSGFSSRFYSVVKSQLTEKMRVQSGSTGAGGTRRFKVYKMKDVRLILGGQEAMLASIDILAKPMGADMDVFFGNLGQDVFGAFQSYTFDFVNMTFTARR